MVVLSLVANVLVLIPVLWSLLSNTPGSVEAFGPDEPARRILISIYIAIALLSLALLFWPAGRAMLAPGLLSVQVVYKFVSVFVLGLGHPVGTANLLIALLHAVTLWTLIR